MQDFSNYSFTIKEADLLRVLKDAASHGYQPLVMINGEFYNLELETTAASADPVEIF